MSIHRPSQIHSNMSAKAEFITATAFAAIMVLIGLGAIWIVRWQTYFLLHHQGEPRGSLPLRLFSRTHLNQAMTSSGGFGYQSPSRLHEGPSSWRPLIQHPTITTQDPVQLWLILSTHRQTGFHICLIKQSWTGLGKKRRLVAQKARPYKSDQATRESKVR